MVNGKQTWIDHELLVRCPRVAGTRRVGVVQTRKDLAREWNAMAANTRNLCVISLRRGVINDVLRFTLMITAETARATALAMRGDPQSNYNVRAYFAQLRIARGAYQEGRTAARDARAGWFNLGQQYNLVPVGALSAGQIASIIECNARRFLANAAATRARSLVTRLWRRLAQDQIYENPGTAAKVLEKDFQEERKPGLNTTLDRDFVADGIAGARWQSVEGRPIVNYEGCTIRVWFMVDNTGRIVDRMVRKVENVEDLHKYTQWKGQLPWELECHRLATIAEAGLPLKSIVPLRQTALPTVRSWVDRVNKTYSVYMAWCPHRDLTELISLQATLPVPAGQPPPPLPEPFIWNVAESLIRSGRYMANFRTTNNGDEMVHRDLKPSNVFLDQPNANNYSVYPQAQIADFGQAFMTGPNDEKNPDWWTGLCGTNGYMAPELVRYVDPATGLAVDDFWLEEYTNVWQAGATLRSLVLLRDPPVQSLFLDRAGDATYRVNVAGTRAAGIYSASLLQMIDDLMQWTCNLRPTFAALEARINTLNGVADVSLGMRGGTADQAVRNANSLAPQAWPVDLYRLQSIPPAPV